MSIIEREIEKRQAIIDSKEDKLAKAVELREEAQKLETEALAIQTEVLVEEILELKSYLPQPEVEEPVDSETV